MLTANGTDDALPFLPVPSENAALLAAPDMQRVETLAALQLFGVYSLPWSGITYVLPSFIALVVVSLLTKEKEATE